MPKAPPDGEASAPAALKMLVFDVSYTSRIVLERQLTGPILARDLGGFFGHVWSVQPLDTIFLPAGAPERFGRPSSFELASRHTFISGTMARYRWLRWLKPLNFILAQASLVRSLSRLIKRERIDVIRAEDSWYCGLLALYLARRHRLPLVIGVWGNPGAIRKLTGKPLMPRLFRRIWIEEAVERFVLRQADRTIVQNEDNRQFVISMGVKPANARFFRLGNILHPMHFDAPEDRPDGRAELAELGLEDCEVLLAIARLEPLKFPEHLVRALALLKDSRPRARLLFAGDGTLRPRLEALARELGVDGRVVFAGNRDQEWLYRITPHVAAVLAPLAGRALAEAGLAGVPLLAYDIDWHGELIVSGVSGELVPNLDYQALAQATERVLSRPDYRATLGRNARARVLDLLNPAKNDAEQKQEYLEMLRERGRI